MSRCLEVETRELERDIPFHSPDYDRLLLESHFRMEAARAKLDAAEANVAKLKAAYQQTVIAVRGGGLLVLPA